MTFQTAPVAHLTSTGCREPDIVAIDFPHLKTWHHAAGRWQRTTVVYVLLIDLLLTGTHLLRTPFLGTEAGQPKLGTS